jgi:hypothetical protein
MKRPALPYLLFAYLVAIGLYALSATRLAVHAQAEPQSSAAKSATPTKSGPNILEDDDPSTFGPYDAKKGFNNSVGTAIVQHGNYAQTNDPPCIGSGQPNADSNCQNVYVFLPLTAHVAAVGNAAREYGSATWGACNPYCSVGWSKFEGSYQIYSTPNNVVVAWTFKNWSHNRTREAMVSVNWN